LGELVSKLSMPQMARAGQGARIKQAHAQQRAAELAKQRVTVRCAHCTGPGNHGRIGRPFQYTGPILEAQQRFAQHRARAHPELPGLEQIRVQQRRHRRDGVTKQASGQFVVSYGTRREFATPEELREREELRREVRSDLPPLDAHGDTA
jgi:hypothetical protein